MPSVVKGHSRFRDIMVTNRHVRTEEWRCHPSMRRRVWMEFRRPLNKPTPDLPMSGFVKDGPGYLWGN